ncbi:uncharacterized protein LOC132557683 [Ylistrum balloti]|uniref:uncharacterized protein LOC132557683 n=1 Tax=Ylistrum balloti TaxID=509963 RepID=UPI0029058229|nr:uncharacterized protein LOC132557683 [Ylistrum balloti]
MAYLNQGHVLNQTHGMNQYGPPLPQGWQHAFTPEGKIYFINHNDGTTSWNDPRIRQSLLLGIIKRYNCATANKEQVGLQEREWRDIRSKCREEGNEDTLKACVKALQEQVCVKGFPSQESAGAEMAIEVYQRIEDVMEVCVKERKVTAEACQKMLFELLIGLLETGPGSTAAHIIQKRLVRTQNIDKYLEDLKGEEFTRIIESLKLWTHSSEGPDMTVKDQSQQWEYCTSKVLSKTLGDKKSDKVYEPAIHQQILELYLFYFEKIGKEPEEYAKHVCSVMDVIQACYRDNHERNPKKNWIMDVWDDILNMLKKYYSSKNAKKYEKVLRDIKYLLEKLPEEVYKNHPEIVDSLVPVLTELAQKHPENVDWTSSYTSLMNKWASAKKGTELSWLKLLKVLVKTGTEEGARRCYNTIDEGKFRKIWNWKQNFQHAIDIIKSIGEAQLHVTDNKESDEKRMKFCGNIARKLLEQFSLAKIPEKLNGDLIVLVITTMERKSIMLNRFVEIFITDFALATNKNVIPGVIKRFSLLLFDRDYMWSEFDTKRCGDYFIQKVLDAYSTGKEMPDDVNKTFIRMFIWTMQTEDLEFVDMEKGTDTLYTRVASQHLRTFVDKHIRKQNGHVCKPLIPPILEQMTHEEEDLAQASLSIVGLISTSDPKLLDGHLSYLVAWCKRTGSMDAISALWKPYEESDGVTKQDFQEIMQVIENNADGDFNMEGVLLKAMGEKQPELFTQHHVDFLVGLLGKQYTQYYILLVLGEIIPVQPQLFGENIIKHVLQNPEIEIMYSSAVQKVAVNLGLKKKALVDTILKELVIMSKNCKDSNYQYPILDAIQILAAKYGIDTLKPHRKYFEDLQQNGKTTFLKDVATSIVNAMDGISMEGIVTDVIQTKKKVKELDEKVTKVEGEVKGMKTTVERHDKEIKTAKTEIKTVKKRVDVVEKDVEETKVKVEEIDKKTMSNAPAWSRDLTKLMNPKSDHDWRLLAQRLGYLPQDIKAWATQNDPCMALLSEWYATNKTTEATHAILTTLQEMNRLDAAIILENAMKAVEDVVVEAKEYTKPPPIFLSYQWGHQNEVKLLRQHLLMAGYECWMDVGQMGGGDKLFEKIDNGIRGSKVIICCVSEKYAKSPNCNREVNLSVNLGKPMIPLLMEKMAWPPKGSMGPIFSEYLFVRFFQRGGEETSDKRFWPVPKFQELLMQLNIHKALPDESLIKKEYKNWWVPVAEEIVITKKKTKTGGQNTADSTGNKEETSKSPDVFLSYQWGKQTQIKQLYKRLCELGLTCWMDIYQMGGGDSLYDKIDRGVRGCKIVLSCVTTKYAVSANCRREVSLADSLKKPVIPLLLEKMDWPPSGPMSMVFTQLLFINFYRDEKIQMNWTGDKFDELLTKIIEHVPNATGCSEEMQKNMTKETSDKKTEQNNTATPQTATQAETNSTPNAGKEHAPPPPPPPPPPQNQNLEHSPTAQSTAQPPPYTQHPQFVQPNPAQAHMSAPPAANQQAQYHRQPYNQQQQLYGHTQPQQNVQPYAQQQPYGHMQVQPNVPQQMYGQPQQHMQNTPNQAAPTQAGRTNEKSSSCVLL